MAVVEATDARGAADRVAAALASAATSLGVALPARSLVTAGSAVFDCEMVAVTLISVGTGIPSSQSDPMADLMLQRAPVWQVTLGVSIVRCAQEKPDGARGDRPPRVEWILADSDAASADAAVIATAAYSLTDDGSVPTVAIQFSQPEGGFIATSANLTVPLWA